MRIDKRLRLVLEVERDDGSLVHVHHEPVANDLLERHYLFLSQALIRLYEAGMAPQAAVRLTHRSMQELLAPPPHVDPTKPPPESRFKGVEQSLLAEMWRLTNLLVPSERGWVEVPFYDAMQESSDHLSHKDVEEVKNYIAYFTAASWFHNRRESKGLHALLAEAGGLTTSSTFTEYKNSLPTLKPAANSGVKAQASSTTH